MTEEKTVICRDINNNTQEVPVLELYFRPSVYGVVIKEGAVLLSPQFGDGYDFPGGGVDLGEPLEDAVMREVQEETGLTVSVGEVLLVQNDFFTHPYTGKHMHSVLIYYKCEYVSGELSISGFDEHEKEYAQQAEWVPVIEVGSLKFYNPINSVGLIQDAYNKVDK